jgi:hypothetical protein
MPDNMKSVSKPISVSGGEISPLPAYSCRIPQKIGFSDISVFDGAMPILLVGRAAVHASVFCQRPSRWDRIPP